MSASQTSPVPPRADSEARLGRFPDGAKTVVAVIRSLLAYIVVSLYMLIVGPIAVALAQLFGATEVLWKVGHVGARLALAIVGIRYRLTGTEHLQHDRAAVYCSNHQSNIDPPVLFEAVHPRLRVLYKAEMRKVPVLGRGFELVGFVAVDRRNPEQARESIERGAQLLRDGCSFLIFPEGTRNQTDTLLPFKKGGFVMAIKAGVPIVPIAVQGGRAAMQKGSAVIRPVTVSVRIGEPIETATVTIGNRDKLITTVRERITELLALGPV